MPLLCAAETAHDAVLTEIESNAIDALDLKERSARLTKTHRDFADAVGKAINLWHAMDAEERRGLAWVAAFVQPKGDELRAWLAQALHHPNDRAKRPWANYAAIEQRIERLLGTARDQGVA